jgi:glycosyltransferase involved in cell wall biosynthesis
MEKLISIVIPIYNVENYLPKILNVLQQQNSQDLEIILVDDGSTDNSSYIAKKYAASNGFCYYYQKNEGLSSARNFGLAKSTGKYIHFLDSDDFVSDNFYAKVSDALKRNNPDILLTNLIYHFPQKNKKDYYFSPLPIENHKSAIYKEFPIIQTKIYLKEYLKSSNLVFTKHLYEDVTFFTNSLLKTDNILICKDAIIYYVQRPDSIMKINDGRIIDIEKSIYNIIEYYKKNNAYEEYHEEIEALAVKNLLLASLNRVTKINNRETGDEIIRSHWKMIKTEFPQWRKNSLICKVHYRTKYNKFLLKIQFNQHISLTIFRILYYRNQILKNRRTND